MCIYLKWAVKNIHFHYKDEQRSQLKYGVCWYLSSSVPTYNKVKLYIKVLTLFFGKSGVQLVGGVSLEAFVCLLGRMLYFLGRII